MNVIRSSIASFQCPQYQRPRASCWQASVGLRMFVMAGSEFAHHGRRASRRLVIGGDVRGLVPVVCDPLGVIVKRFPSRRQSWVLDDLGRHFLCCSPRVWRLVLLLLCLTGRMWSLVWRNSFIGLEKPYLHLSSYKCSSDVFRSSRSPEFPLPNTLSHRQSAPCQSQFSFTDRHHPPQPSGAVIASPRRLGDSQFSSVISGA